MASSSSPTSSDNKNNNPPIKEKSTIPVIQPKRNTDPNVLAPFNPTNAHTQSTALELFDFHNHSDSSSSSPQPHHVLFDLGCGDGRLLIQAVQDFPHVRCVGLELDPVFVQRALERIATLPKDVQERIDIRQADLTEASLWESRRGNNSNNDNESNKNHANNTSEENPNLVPLHQLTLLDDATCIYIYLLPQGIVKLLPFLRTLIDQRQAQQRPLKIIACTFRLREWEPSVTVNTGKSGVIKTYLYEFGTTVSTATTATSSSDKASSET